MKVSAVIPAYNEERYIARCVETLIAQTYRNIEIIIVDDGSTDKTRDIIKELQRKHKNLKLLRQNHGGPGRARNLGAKNASGKILVLVDADMEFDEHYIERLVKPILQGKTKGTFHMKECVANTHNIWARCWGTTRVDPKTAPARSGIFRAILRKDFLQAGGFDPAKGSFDDQSIAEKTGMRAVGVPGALCYHNNPTTLREIFRQNRWIGGSFIVNPGAILRHTRRFWLVIMALVVMAAAGLWGAAQIMPLRLIPVIAIPGAVIALITILTARRLLFEPDAMFIVFLPIFHVFAGAGFVFGALRQGIAACRSILLHRPITYHY